MMDWNVLRYIVEVAQTGSISKAAANLYISQPTLSAQLTAFERQIGRKLFVRSTHGVQLTREGALVYAHALSVERQCNVIECRLFEDINANKVTVASFGSEIINVIFFEICRRFSEPNYEFSLLESGTEETIARVRERDVDLGIIMYSDAQQKRLRSLLPSEGLEMEELFSGIMQIRVSESSPLAKKECLTASDLEGMFNVCDERSSRGAFSFDPELEEMGVPREKTILTSGHKALHDALEALNAYSVGPTWSCRERIGKLARIPFDRPPIRMHCGALHRRGELLKEELGLFVGMLTDAYGWKP